jgi:hypothetical protein
LDLDFNHINLASLIAVRADVEENLYYKDVQNAMLVMVKLEEKILEYGSAL